MIMNVRWILGLGSYATQEYPEYGDAWRKKIQQTHNVHLTLIKRLETS